MDRGTARRGRRPSAPSGRPRRASAGGSAAGRRPDRPRGPRSSRACRPAGCAGRGRPTRPARAGMSSSRSSRRGTPAAACWCGRARRRGPGAPPGRPRSRTNSPLSPNRRASSRSERDRAGASAAPTAIAKATATRPATRQTRGTTSKSWSERNIALRGADHPGDDAATATSGDQRRAASAPNACGTASRPRARAAPTRAGQAAAISDDVDLVAGHAGELPAVADAPDRDQPRRRGRVALDLLAQPAHVHRDRREVAVRPAPHLRSRSSRLNTWFGCFSRNSNRSNSRTVRASSTPDLKATLAEGSSRNSPHSSTDSGVNSSMERRSTDCTRSTSSRARTASRGSRRPPPPDPRCGRPRSRARSA